MEEGLDGGGSLPPGRVEGERLADRSLVELTEEQVPVDLHRTHKLALPRPLLSLPLYLASCWTYDLVDEDDAEQEG